MALGPIYPNIQRLDDRAKIIYDIRPGGCFPSGAVTANTIMKMNITECVLSE